LKGVEQQSFGQARCCSDTRDIALGANLGQACVRVLSDCSIVDGLRRGSG
jgi:hypothetical protein